MGSGRAVRKNLNKINSQLLELEEDHAALELVYPQARSLTSNPGTLELIAAQTGCLKVPSPFES